MKLALRLLKEGRRDEKTAPKFYGRLKKALPYKYRKTITLIQNQEKRHYRILKKIEKEIKDSIKQ